MPDTTVTPSAWDIELARTRIARHEFTHQTHDKPKRRMHMLQAWIDLDGVMTTLDVYEMLRLTFTPRPSRTTVNAILGDLEDAGLVKDLGTTWNPHPEAAHLTFEIGVISRLWRRL